MIAKHSRPGWWVIDGRNPVEIVHNTIMQALSVEGLVGWDSAELKYKVLSILSSLSPEDRAEILRRYEEK
jgi:hypothetical protein